MSAHWHIGMEVECIDNGQPGYGVEPTIGAKYVISEVLEYSNGVTLQFKTLRFEGDSLTWPGFADSCFRPVQKRQTDISLLTALLNPSREQADEFIAADHAKHTKEAAEALAQALYPMERPLW